MISEFTKPVTPQEFIIPFISASVMIIAFVLMLYLFLKFRKRYDYAILAVISLASFIFAAFMGLTVVVGGLYMNAEAGMRLYRFAHLGVSLVLIAVIPYCSITFTLNPNIHRNLHIISCILFLAGTIAIIVSFQAPDLFLSITRQNHYAFLYEMQSMWGKGETGPLYNIRNLLNFVALSIMLYCACYDMFVNKLVKERLSISIAVVMFVWGALEDLYAFSAGSYLFLPNILYSRFAFAVVIFSIILVMRTFKYFLNSSLLAKKTQQELQSRQKRNAIFMDKVKDFTDKIASLSGSIEETSSNLQKVSEKTVDSLVITKMHSGASHQASVEFSKIASIQKNHIEEVIIFTSGLFDSLSDVRRNINNQKNNISDTIEYTSKLAFTMDSMNDATENITMMSDSIKEYTIEKKKNIVDAFKKFEDVTAITAQILNSIDFIKDIAHKTNLLSINSGIQASKAGQYGRGFSVLSREIRDLSASTHLGTQEIETLLISIAETLKGVSNIRDYVLGSFDSIIEHVNETTNSIDEIVTYMKYQAEKNEFLKLNIQMLDSSSEVIDSSIKHQNEYTLYVQKNMNLIFKDFEDVSAMSIHQTKDLDSIDKDITTVSRIGKELYTYSTSILEYYNTMSVQNDKMIDIIEKFNQVLKSTEDEEVEIGFEDDKPKVEIDDERLLDSQKPIEELFSADEEFVMDEDYVAFDDREEEVLNGVRSVDNIFVLDDNSQDEYSDTGVEIDIDKIMRSLEGEIVVSERSIEDLFVADDDFALETIETPILDIDKIIDEIEEEFIESEKSVEDLFVLDADYGDLSDSDTQFAEDYLDHNVDVDKVLAEIEDEVLESKKSIEDLFVLDENFVPPSAFTDIEEIFDVEQIIKEIEKEQSIDKQVEDRSIDSNDSMEYLESISADEFNAEPTVSDTRIEDPTQTTEEHNDIDEVINNIDMLDAILDNESKQFADDYLNRGVDIDRVISDIENEQSTLYSSSDDTSTDSSEHELTQEDVFSLDDGHINAELNAHADEDAQFADDYLNKGVDVDRILEEIAQGQQATTNDNTHGQIESITKDSSLTDDALSYLDSIAVSEFDDEKVEEASDNDESNIDSEAQLDSEPSDSTKSDDNRSTIDYLDSIATDYALEHDIEMPVVEHVEEDDSSYKDNEETLNYLDSIAVSGTEFPSDNTENENSEGEYMDEEDAQELADLFDSILSDSDRK